MKKILLILFIALLSFHLFAIRATPDPVQIKQPDGTVLTIRLRGDEFFKYKTTTDGYLIKMDESGFYRYAQPDLSGRIIITGQKVNEIGKRTAEELLFIKSLNKNITFNRQSLVRKAQKISNKTTMPAENAFPLTGSPRSLVILANFTDKSFVTSNPKTAFTNLLNKSGYSTNGGTGSARDYFIESSFGQFSPQFDVVGPVNLPQNMEFYGKNQASDDDINPQQMVIDACVAADALGVDFSQYDLDNNGIVDNIFIYYAGYNEAEGGGLNTVWPHRWSLNNLNTKLDGKAIYDYACTSELKDAGGNNMCGIGTFCHEFGHVLGLVDYYHTTDDNKLTLEKWSIMDAGAYLNEGRTPPSYSSYERFFLKWLTPTELKSPSNAELNPLLSGNEALLVCKNNHNLIGNNPNPNEFFLFEYRKRTGFDAYLPGEGLLIWHIDYDFSEWNNNSPNNYEGYYQTAESHMRVYLQPIGNSTTTPGNAFTSGSFRPTLWDGEDLNKPLNFILVENNKVRFKFMGGYFNLSTPVATAASDVQSARFTANWQTVTGASGYYLTVYNKSAGETIQTEEFDNGLKAPEQWKITASGLTTSDNFSGDKIPAILFSSKNDTIQTEKYISAVDKLSFFVKSMGSTSGKVKVEASNGVSWITVNEFTVNLMTSETKTFDFNLSSDYKQFRLTYSSVDNSIAIDDITVKFGEMIHYNCKNKWTTLTSDTIYNLISGRTHYYVVKASDRTLNPDKTVMYENFTDYSNTITVTTQPASSSKYLRVEREFLTGKVFVFTADLNTKIHIYNTAGQLINSINPVDLRTDISPYLKKHNLYLIFAGDKSNKFVY